MSPNTRQSTLNFRVKKNIQRTNSNKEEAKDDDSLKSCNSGDYNATSCLSPKKSNLGQPSDSSPSLTPASAIATLLISSPNEKSLGCHSENGSNAFKCGDLLSREKELEELEQFLTSTLLQHKPGSMYISGLPGTGKTAALTKILENVKMTGDCLTAFVNCTAVPSSGAIYYQIAEALKLKPASKSAKATVTVIEKCLKYNYRSQKMILLVLDEMDQLQSKFQSVLYRIFEWPTKKDSRLVLIGIANAVDLTDRVLPRLRTLSLQPRLLHFRPYTKEQIVQILRHRLSQTKEADFFAPGALELLSAKVAGQSGDLRRALDLGRRVLEMSKFCASRQDKTPDSPDNILKATSQNDLNASIDVENNELSQSRGLRRSPRKMLTALSGDALFVVSPRKRSYSSRYKINGKDKGQKNCSDSKSEELLTEKKEGNLFASPTEEKNVSETRLGIKADITLPKVTDNTSEQTSEVCKSDIFVPRLTYSERSSPRKKLNFHLGKTGTIRTDVNGTSLSNLVKEPFLNQGESEVNTAIESVDSKIDKFAMNPRKSPRKQQIHATDVLSVVKQMQGSARSLSSEESAFPIHQKLLVCSLLLMITKGRNKDITIGKLHEVYSKVCSRRGISAVDQSGFIFLCRQVEMAGAVQIGKGHGRLAKVTLQWDETEVTHALQDTSLLTAIMTDTSVLTKN